jgi:hypothetical protein
MEISSEIFIHLLYIEQLKEDNNEYLKRRFIYLAFAN